MSDVKFVIAVLVAGAVGVGLTFLVNGSSDKTSEVQAGPAPVVGKAPVAPIPLTAGTDLVSSKDLQALEMVQLELNQFDTALQLERKRWALQNPLMKKLQVRIDEIKAMQGEVTKIVRVWESSNPTFKKLKAKREERAAMLTSLAMPRKLNPACYAGGLTDTQRRTCGKELWAIADSGAIARVQK